MVQRLSVVKCVARRGVLVPIMIMGATLPQAAWAQSDIVLQGASVSKRAGKWAVQSDSSSSRGSVIRHPDGGAAKIETAKASPADYFEITFEAQAGVPYRLWIRGRADRDSWANDSVFVQFDRSVTTSGASRFRIATTSAAEVNLEECSGCGLKAGWSWQDNGWGKGVLGPTIQFASSGTQRMRVQTREDGLGIDQIVLSPSTYLKTAPSGAIGGSSSSGGSSATDVVLHPANASARVGKWTIASDSAAINGKKLRHPDAGRPKIDTAKASPADYFELTFNAVKGVPYRLWLHGRADGDSWANDSVFIQFSGSVTSSGSARYRIGTTSATEVNLEECNGCGLPKGWAWQDNGWGKGVLGPTIYFATTGTQKMRVQTREDGLSIDRILLSPSTYLTKAPPAISGSTSSGSTTTSSTTSTTSTSTSTSTSTTTSSTLKVLHWNIHHGVGTDGKYDISRIADWIVKTGAHVVSLNEVEKNVGGWGNEDQPARFASLLKSKTGKTWYYHFAHRTGGTSGQGNLLLSRYPIESKSSRLISYSRSVARIAIIVNGFRVNVFSTHLDADSSSRRATQMKELTKWAATFPEQRILAGDYNAWPGAWEISNMTSGHFDAWAVAKSAGTAVAYSGNTAGNTRNSRIDYIFYSKGATRLKLKEARVWDTRNSSGHMASDHRPLTATYDVR